MTTFLSPHLRKGALVSVDLGSPLPQVIVFQYNLVILNRSLEPQMASDGGERSEALRLKGADFSGVKVHTDGRDDALNQALTTDKDQCQ
jgi:hypothetical protein